MKQTHHVPTDWTAEQALAMVDWMQGFVDAIWQVYGDVLLELLANRPLENPDDFDLPF